MPPGAGVPLPRPRARAAPGAGVRLEAPQAAAAAAQPAVIGFFLGSCPCCCRVLGCLGPAMWPHARGHMRLTRYAQIWLIAGCVSLYITMTALGLAMAIFGQSHKCWPGMELPACLWPRRIGGITCSVRLRVRPGAWMQLSCQHFALEASFAPNGACFGCL